MTVRIGFIGAGKMATAMIEGIISKGLYAKDEIIACNRDEKKRAKIEKDLGIKIYGDVSDVVKQTDTIVLAVKPQQIEEIIATKFVGDFTKKLVISIAAGVKIGTLEGYVPDAKIIRVMPNVCCTVSESASSYTLGTKATAEDGQKVKKILEAVGIAFEVKEDDIDAVTGLSGSSPAYMFMVIDAMADGGVLMGLPRDVSVRLAAQTMLGAAKTVLETGRHPEELKDSVCSPGGTTIEGVKVLEDYGIRGAFISAIQASAERSKEMGRK